MVRDKEDTMSRLMRLIATMLALVFVAGACSANPASKAGGEEPPIVLKIGTNDSPGRPAADQIEEFAARAADLSEGKILIEPVWRVGGMNTPHWDQTVARQVGNGELDMGNIPSRAFDILGVTSLQALSAPFLITDDELFDEVVTSDMADDMMSGLEDIGLVGLALLPEGLRHPFGFEEGLLGPEDYEGGVLRAPASATTAAVFEALGAVVVDGELDPVSQIGAESAYILEPPGTATHNVVLYAKANVLVVNADVFARFNESQVEILERAASGTLTWSIESRPSDSAAAEDWCASGRRIVTADEETVTALRDAVEGVYQQLRTDALTAELIDQIGQMRMSIPVSEPVIPDGCTGEPGDTEAAAEGKDDPSVINGSYRIEWSADELFDALVGGTFLPPVPADDAELLASIEKEATNNAGVVIFIFNDGHFDNTYETGFFAGDHCNGTYAISGNRITMVASSDPAEWQCGNEDLGRTFVDAAWELNDQGLLLSDFLLSEEPDITWWNRVFLGAKPLVRVD
jgi:TRAP-type C4-dicarboxylate transport system substrate-binding protein